MQGVRPGRQQEQHGPPHEAQTQYGRRQERGRALEGRRLSSDLRRLGGKSDNPRSLKSLLPFSKYEKTNINI